MHVDVINIWFGLLLLIHYSQDILAECTVKQRDSKLSLSPLVQFYGVDPTSGLTKHVFLSTASAFDGLTVDLLNYTLSAEAGILADSSSCPADCLTTLTAYMNEKEKLVVMLRPVDVLNFPGYYNMDIGVIYCTTAAGYCGADAPLYLYYSATLRDYYIGLASESRSTYSVQNSGKPHCFVWSNIDYTTTTTTSPTTLLTIISTSSTVTSSTITNGTNTSTATTTTTVTPTTSTIINNGSTSTSSTTITTPTNTTSAGTSSTSTNLTSTRAPYTTTHTSTTGASTITSTTGSSTSTITTETSTTAGTTTVSYISTSSISSGSSANPSTAMGTTIASQVNNTTPGGQGIATNSPDLSGGRKDRKKKPTSRFWPVALAAVVLLGAVVLTVLALSSLRIIRSNRDRVSPYKNSSTPPPPYNPYNHDPGTTNLPPAPVDAMSAPRPFTVGAPPGLPGAAPLY